MRLVLKLNQQGRNIMNKQNIAFTKFYSKVAVEDNYIKPKYARMDNWAVDRYESGDLIAGMSDAGYRRYIGQRDSDGKVKWRIDESYGPGGTKYEYFGITQEEFEALEF